MQINEVRKRFLRYMKSRGHTALPSASLIPQEDATTLFTGSGMQPLVPFLLGREHPQGTRLADSQKCFRANDIDEVGDNRHTTFFEMLGNWSLGDYFKEEQIRQCFEFLTSKEVGLGLNPEHLYVTVFAGDEEFGIPRDDFSASIWKELFEGVGVSSGIAHIGSQERGDEVGMQRGDRIFFYDAEKNWWSRAGAPKNMPVGEPGGPDTEVFYDFGKEFEDPAYQDCKPHPNSDSGRFLEICNSVFMEYMRDENGFVPLPKKNVDFGGGLERMVAATQHNPDVFLCDVFASAVELLASHAPEKTYATHPKPYRIIADHLRSALFIIAEGVVPSNTDRGYVLRRLLRKAMYAIRYQLDITDISLADVGKQYIAIYQNSYPEVCGEAIITCIVDEEKKFSETLQKGMSVFEKLVNRGELTGEAVFKLQSTYGFPFELTTELAQQRGIDISEEAYCSAMSEHKETSRQGLDKKFRGGLSDTDEMSVKYHTATHLLHQALRDVLGDTAVQRGSNITPDRMRFDFAYDKKMTEDEIARVNAIVNEKIQENLAVTYEDIPYEEAKGRGAIGLFDYGDTVRVYAIGGYSLEMCGGPHTENTGVLGSFSIVKEEAVGSGVRRIKAVLS